MAAQLSIKSREQPINRGMHKEDTVPGKPQNKCMMHWQGDEPRSPAWEARILMAHILCTMEYYWAMKKNEIVSFAEMWMDLETVIQSESKFEREKEIY